MLKGALQSMISRRRNTGDLTHLKKTVGDHSCGELVVKWSALHDNIFKVFLERKYFLRNKAVKLQLNETNMENMRCYARSFWRFSTSLHAFLPF